MLFTTTHKPKKHTAIIDGKSYGPFKSEIELVSKIPANLSACTHINTDVRTQDDFTHTWKKN